MLSARPTGLDSAPSLSTLAESHAAPVAVSYNLVRDIAPVLMMMIRLDHDGRPVWTSTDCGRCGVTSKMAHQFNANGGFGASSCRRVQDGLGFARCCADEGSKLALISGTSCKTCTELGWGQGEGLPNVCGASEIISDGAGGTQCLNQAVTLEV